MSLFLLKFNRLSDGVVISYSSNKEIAGLVFGKRAIFYYPPGSKTGWTFKRIVAVSLLGYLFWAVIIMAVELFCQYLTR